MHLARREDGTGLTALITACHELNAAVIDELFEEPSPLEFMRYVARNRPFVVRGAAADWQASQRWDAEYLKRVMQDQVVRVAVTPNGNADAVVEQPDGLHVFVEPHETFESLSQFLDDIRQSSTSEAAQQNVKYAQTQNDNLRNEYEELAADVPKDIAFARIALGSSADAINLWLGDNRSVTSLHKDNYENIYVQVRGEKHFVLLPPVEMPCVNETRLPKGRYKPASSIRSGKTNFLEIEVHAEADRVPVAMWDPDEPEKRTTPYSHLSRPLRVTLQEGDLLYLPAMWYHKVSQTVGKEGFVAAVNYWYDMDYAGSFWATNSFVRDVANAEAKKPQYPDLTVDGEEVARFG